MEKKQIAVGDPITISGITIIPVIQTQVDSWPYNGGINFFGLKKPLYLLVSSPKSPVKAFDMYGKETPIEEIEQKFPELQPVVNRFSSE